MRSKLFITLFFVLFGLGRAGAEPKGLHTFVGAGNNYIFPGTIRVGWNDWEFGRLNLRAYGAAKLFFFSPRLYTNFGLIFGGTSSQTAFGVMAGLGFLYELPWSFGVRAEMDAQVFGANIAFSQGVVGLTYDF